MKLGSWMKGVRTQEKPRVGQRLSEQTRAQMRRWVYLEQSSQLPFAGDVGGGPEPVLLNSCLQLV